MFQQIYKVQTTKSPRVSAQGCIYMLQKRQGFQFPTGQDTAFCGCVVNSREQPATPSSIFGQESTGGCHHCLFGLSAETHVIISERILVYYVP